ncbi:endogenous retrovirus group K member 18 Env polyprotein-like isoform X1 [Dipodomys merriami]|uniref:endogenous retrovirus group K member 18 Env polyprotein-like isoform X2 n=1 Tax=Dipodomys merriami TaxID=94247 RepID=UPI003850FF47
MKQGQSLRETVASPSMYGLLHLLWIHWQHLGPFLTHPTSREAKTTQHNPEEEHLVRSFADLRLKSGGSHHPYLKKTSLTPATWGQNKVLTQDRSHPGVFQQLLKRTRRFLGLSVAVILEMTAITMTAATAGVSLHSSIQTKDFVEKWLDCHQLWTHQHNIKQDIDSRLNTLQHTVQWMGDQIIDLQKQLTFKCD